MQYVLPILEVLIHFMALVLLATAPIMAKWAAKYLDTKLGFAIKQAHMDQLILAIDEGILLMEEEGLALAKRGLPPLTNSAKLSGALRYVLKSIEQDDLPDKGADWIAQRIRARLPALGLGASEVKDDA